MIILFVNVTLPITQMNNKLYKPVEKALFRPVDSHATRTDPAATTFFLLARIFRMMHKFNMKSQESISQTEAMQMAQRITSKLKSETKE